MEQLKMDAVRVEASHIELAYGATKVLRDVSIMVEPGEFFALLGPSGSGKSTLLRLIAGFNQHQSGRLLIGDRDVTGVPPWKRNVGMVFQNYALWPHMSVARNVAFGLEERRLPRDEIRRKVGSSGSPSPGRSPSSRRCCCSTSRCPTWTRSCACRCAGSSGACTTGSASLPYSSRTTRRRR